MFKFKLKQGFNILAIVVVIALELVFVMSYWYYIYNNFLLAATGINDTISYQGKISDTDGVLLADGTYKMRFAVYNHLTSGSIATPSTFLLWEEWWDGTTRSGDQVASSLVTVTNGVFAVELNSLCQDWTAACATNNGVNFNTDNLYLEVEIDANAT